MTHIFDIKDDEFAVFYKTYIARASTSYTLIEELEISLHRFIKFVQNVSLDKIDYKYQIDKWTLKDIIQHLIDSERVFAYRAMCIARDDKTNFPSFDENNYAQNAVASTKTIKDLLTDYLSLRQATICLFKSFTTIELLRCGTAAGSLISVRALGFIIIGHQNHHQKIFLERYL